MAGRRRRTIIAVAALAVAVLVGSLLPQVRVRAVAAVTLADGLGAPVWRPFAPEVERRSTSLAGVPGDLYDPGRDVPAIVLVPGAAPRGRHDPRVVRLAEAVARSKRVVFVPELEVYDQQLVVEDIEGLVRAATALADRGHGPVVLLGTSFGGSLCLLAAADPRLEDQVALVATFGAYFDLVGVVQAATTGHGLVAGGRTAWPADPRAEMIVRDRLLELLPRGAQRALVAALDGELDAEELPPAARAAYRLLTNDDPRRSFPLAAELPGDVRRRISEVSPSSVARRLGDVPVVAMHTTDDPAVPYAELLRLGAALPHAELVTVASFEHVDLDVTAPSQWPGAVRDLWRTWRFTRMVLDAQR